MRFIHLADLHFGIKKYGITNPETGLNTRIEEDLNQFDKIINFAIKIEVKLFLIAGDVFDKRKPDEIIQREFAKRIKRLIDEKIIVIVLIGNHDGTTATDTTHCLSSIVEINDSKYLHIVDEAKVMEFNELNLLVACLPYDRNDKYIDFLLKKDVPTILLGHTLISGANQNGFIFKKGMSVLSYKVKQIVYKAFGHIHEHQKIGSYVYSGSINRINFGDEDNKKGFIYGMIKDGKCKWKFKQLRSRMFKTIDAIWGTGIKKMISKLDIKNTVVKLNIKDEKGNAVIPIVNIKKFLDEKGAIIDSVNIVRETKEQVRDKSYNTDLSPYKMLRRYLRNEKKETVDKGIKILKGIKNETN